MSLTLDLSPPRRLDAQPRREPSRVPRQWCVAQTHPQAELWAQTNLTRLGYVTYLPLYTARVRDRAVPSLFHTVTKPLFARYIFIRHDNPTLWRPIREAPGIATVLTAAGRITPVANAAVEALQAGEDARRCPPPENAQWAPGTPCRAATGVLAGHDAVVIAITNATARVALPLLGALREVTVPIEWLTTRE